MRRRYALFARGPGVKNTMNDDDKAKEEKEMKVPAQNSMEQMLNMAKRRGIL